MLVRTAVMIALIGVVGFAAWTLLALTAKEEHGFLAWHDAAVTGAGRDLYGEHCGLCHGMPDGTALPANSSSAASAPPHDETGHTWQHPDYALFQLIRDGVAVANCLPVDEALMPRFRGIVSDQELVAILSYIKSTWPESVREHHDRVNVMYGPYNRAVRDLIGAQADEEG